jgi:hypothetical protein
MTGYIYYIVSRQMMQSAVNASLAILEAPLRVRMDRLFPLL